MRWSSRLGIDSAFMFNPLIAAHVTDMESRDGVALGVTAYPVKYCLGIINMPA